MIYSSKTITKLQKEKNFSFKKKLGQNFIVDENTINNIVSKAEIDSETLVIEIGPGIGSLTYKLCEVAKMVVCYEIDKSLELPLKENLAKYSNYSIIFDDFLKVNVEDELKKYNYNKVYIVANLPYYITTPIIFKIIEDKLNIDKIVIMLQKEVGDRLKAQPKTKDYNSLSIFINYYYDVRKIMDVSRNIFIPVPNVDSSVIELKKKTSKFTVLDEKKFFKLVKDSFVQKRKTIKNNLINYDLNIIETILAKHGQTLTARAEEISIDTFVEIANEMVEKNV